MSGLLVQRVAGSVRIAVRVQPRSSATEIVGIHGTALRIRVHAPPVDGAANDAVIRLLAERLGIQRSRVRVVAGMTSRSKIVELRDVNEDDVQALAGAGSR
ncbi:MAG: hypothetical protein MNPFHGCM_02047 [Gemmatimonadaceae bacterium]|nr:hypothetical protein [Gemmatimonadaceae bacterium]